MSLAHPVETAPLLPETFARWFAQRGWTPRAHQLELLARARTGRSVLLIAPTGGGKTLAGFLPALVELSETRNTASPRTRSAPPARPLVSTGRDVLRAGLSSAPWITVDDTGARHKAANGFCTQIGNAHFAWFGTTDSKSRLNFLELLRAGHCDYVINAEALAYMCMRHRSLASPVIVRHEP